MTFHEEIWDDVSVECKDLVRKMLEKRPRNRLSYVQCLNHNWFKSKSQTHNLENFDNVANQSIVKNLN